MTGHIFKMVWNNRKKFTAIFLEQILVFIILLLSTVSLSLVLDKYWKPGLVDSENVVYFGYAITDFTYNADKLEAIAKEMDLVLEKLRKEPSVIAVSESFNLMPYMRPNDFYYKDSVTLNGQKYLIDEKGCDEYGLKVFGFDLEEGEWLPSGMLENGYYPAVITRQLAEMAGWKNAVGKKIEVSAVEKYSVTGIISGIKQSPLSEARPALISLNTMFGTRRTMQREFGAKIKSGRQQDFNNLYYKEFKENITDKNVELFARDLDHSRGQVMLSTTMDLFFQIIPTLFLSIFSFIGTFGLFWIYSQKRMKEFGLRLALGATRKELVSMVIGESAIVTVTAALPGLLLAFFIYPITIAHFIAIMITFLIMLSFSIFSAWYPAFLATRTNPAKALHYE